MSVEHYKKLLVHLEYLKEDLMLRINAEDSASDMENITRNTAYPLGKVRPFIINGYTVFYFAYDGAMPLYKEKDNKYLSMIRHYYYRATLDSCDFTAYENLFGDAVLHIQHWFNDTRIRDLDNRCRKYLIDAVRHTGLIKDDSWDKLSIFEEGKQHNDENMVLVYLLEKENYINFLTKLDRANKDLKVIPEKGVKEKICKDYEEQKKMEMKYTSIKKAEGNEGFWG